MDKGILNLVLGQDDADWMLAKEKSGQQLRRAVKGVLNYQFFFAPEGRLVDTIPATSLTAAKKAFYAKHTQYKRAKGEVYSKVE
jgi:hypothetical protein